MPEPAANIFLITFALMIVAGTWVNLSKDWKKLFQRYPLVFIKGKDHINDLNNLRLNPKPH
jgi:hypothetical protein